MFGRKLGIKGKIKILLVDELNDLQSQIAEYFINDLYDNQYYVYSAGPKSGCIDCELISAMYQMGYDIRTKKSKNFSSKDIPDKLDYVIFLEKETYDKFKNDVPWDAPQILVDFGRKNNFEKATDDIELFEYYRKFVEKIKLWTEKTFENPNKLKLMAKAKLLS
ncbi:MAG: hypothetical protein MJY54_03160 [archaeon]|nr:hypothetical protein [archaeon]